MIISKQSSNEFTISMTEKEFIAFSHIISLIRYQTEKHSKFVILHVDKFFLKQFITIMQDNTDILSIFSEDLENYEEIARNYDDTALFDYTDDSTTIIENLFKEDNDYVIFIAHFVFIDNFFIRLSI